MDFFIFCNKLILDCIIYFVVAFSCLQLRMDAEPLKGLLGRVLRRRILSAEADTRAKIPQARILASWLVRLLSHLNQVISDNNNKDNDSNSASAELVVGRKLSFISTSNASSSSSMSQLGSISSMSQLGSISRSTLGSVNSCGMPLEPTIISPSLLLDCPVDDLLESERWFISAWNESIVPALRSSLNIRGTGLTSTEAPPAVRGGRGDPAQWVKDTYPWPTSLEQGAQRLMK